MSDYTLVITRTFKVSREKVWDAWTNKEELQKWFGPETMAAEFTEFNFTEGGPYTLVMKNKDGTGGAHSASGIFETIDEPSKLIYTWQWMAGVDEYKNKTQITIEFKEVDEGTEMTFIHEGFESEQQKIDHNKGWSSSFDSLDGHVSH